MEVLHPSPTPTVPPPIRQNREWTSGFGKERDKLQRSLGGIADMKKLPNLIFIIDTNIESLAVNEAKKLGISVYLLFLEDV